MGTRDIPIPTPACTLHTPRTFYHFMPHHLPYHHHTTAPPTTCHTYPTTVPCPLCIPTWAALSTTHLSPATCTAMQFCSLLCPHCYHTFSHFWRLLWEDSLSPYRSFPMHTCTTFPTYCFLLPTYYTRDHNHPTSFVPPAPNLLCGWAAATTTCTHYPQFVSYHLPHSLHTYLHYLLPLPVLPSSSGSATCHVGSLLPARVKQTCHHRHTFLPTCTQDVSSCAITQSHRTGFCLAALPCLCTVSATPPSPTVTLPRHCLPVILLTLLQWDYHLFATHIATCPLHTLNTFLF